MTTVLPMIKNKKWTEEDIICNMIGDRSYRDAQKWINENIPKSLQISHTSIYNWSLGINVPEDENLKKMIIFYAEGDERRLAAELIMDMRSKEWERLQAHWIGMAK